MPAAASATSSSTSPSTRPRSHSCSAAFLTRAASAAARAWPCLDSPACRHWRGPPGRRRGRAGFDWPCPSGAGGAGPARQAGSEGAQTVPGSSPVRCANGFCLLPTGPACHIQALRRQGNDFRLGLDCTAPRPSTHRWILLPGRAQSARGLGLNL